MKMTVFDKHSAEMCCLQKVWCLCSFCHYLEDSKSGTEKGRPRSTRRLNEFQIRFGSAGPPMIVIVLYSIVVAIVSSSRYSSKWMRTVQLNQISKPKLCILFGLQEIVVGWLVFPFLPLLYSTIVF